MRVRVFSSCLTEIYYPGVMPAALGVLGALGVEAVPLEGVTCCGQAFFNSGHPDMAKKVGQRLFKSIVESEEPVVMLSGSCTVFVKEHYPRLFGIGMGIDGGCFEFTEFLARALEADIKGALNEPVRAAYHPACHLLRGLKLKDEPFALLSRIENLELVRINKEETCCGFGGIFSAVYPEVSARMADEKAIALRDAGAEVFVSADAGCLRRVEKSGFKAAHIAEVLWAGMRP